MMDDRIIPRWWILVLAVLLTLLGAAISVWGVVALTESATLGTDPVWADLYSSAIFRG